MQLRRILSILPILMVCNIIPMTAETLVDGGAVDYNMGAEGLYNMTEFLLVMMHYVTLVLYHRFLDTHLPLHQAAGFRHVQCKWHLCHEH